MLNRSFLSFAFLFPTVAFAQLPHVTAIGDSFTDEYAEQDYGPVAKSWTEILVSTGRINMGPTAAQAGIQEWSGTRRTGYQDNWARYAYRTTDAITWGEASGAASSIVNGAEYVVIFIGNNDFNCLQTEYQNVYHGIWNQQQALDYADSVAANIRTIVETVQSVHGKIVLMPPVDFEFSWFMRNGHEDPELRNLGTTMVRHCRDKLRALAFEKHIVFFDIFSMNIDLFGTGSNIRSYATIGNKNIAMQGWGDNGLSGFIYDGVHPQRVIQSIWGNGILTALNEGFAANIPPISEAEMLAIGGSTYGGTDTLSTILHPAKYYVQNFACLADFNNSGDVGTQDIFDFLAAYFGGDIRADVNFTGDISTQDIFDFLAMFFVGC